MEKRSARVIILYNKCNLRCEYVFNQYFVSLEFVRECLPPLELRRRLLWRLPVAIPNQFRDLVLRLTPQNRLYVHLPTLIDQLKEIRNQITRFQFFLQGS